MRQTLFYIPPEIFGIPLFGPGLLFWLIIAFIVWRLIRALFITKNNADFWGDAVVGLVAVVMVALVAPALNLNGRGLPVRGYGVFLMLAVLFATTLAIWRGKKKWNIPPETLLSVAIVQVIAGLLGARIFYVLEYWPEFIDRGVDGTVRLGSTIGRMVNLTQGGLVVFGSIIGGVVATILYLRAKKLPIWGTLDLFAPALMLGIAIGRIGCFMNGCCFGAICDSVPPGVTFPIASPAHLHQMELGEVSLGGFRLAAPKMNKEGDVGLFRIKSADQGLLAPPDGEPILVEGVEPGSNPETAGLEKGMKILRVGMVRPVSGVATPEEIRGVAMVTPVGTRGLLRFLYENDWTSGSPPTIVFDVSLPESENDGPATDPSEEGKGTDLAKGKTKRIAFQPGPFEVRPVHPTQLYSSASAFCLFLILMGVDRFVRRDGVLFVLMLVLYSVNRFGLELIRTDEASFMGTGLSVSQCVSLLVIIVGVGVLIHLARHPVPRAYETWSPPTED